MKNLKAVVQYECMTSFKYIWVFYAIQYALISFIVIIIGIVMGSFENAGTSVLEMNTLIYIGILGVLGFKEDFKMLIQNGFTRKYIFIATFVMFCFISGTMAFVDTVVGNLIHHFNNNYSSLYGSIYGYDSLFMNWLWLFLAYVLICSLLYLVILVINKVGKKTSVYLSVFLGGAVLLIIVLLRFVFSGKISSKITELLIKAMGFMTDGTINFFFPVLTLCLVVGILGLGAYNVICHSELK